MYNLAFSILKWLYVALYSANPGTVETKGSTVELSATRLVFTSNKHPSEWYSGDADPEGTVMRRINEFCADRGRLIHFVGADPALWDGLE